MRITLYTCNFELKGEKIEGGELDAEKLKKNVDISIHCYNRYYMGLYGL